MRIAVNEQFNIVHGNRRFKGLVIYGIAIIVTAFHRNSDDLALCIAGARIKGAIAGCMVTEGTIKRHNPIRVLRDNVVIYEGELESLRRFKDDVNEVRNGMECGIGWLRIAQAISISSIR